MIYTNVTVKVNNNGTASSNNKVVLYRGDREVEIQMTITGNPFIFQDSVFAQLIIRRDNAAPVITGISPLKDNKVILTITEQNIDEISEVGSYAYQIRLYDEDMSARITLPPVENGLEIREPIVDEASGAIGRAMINYSMVTRPFGLRAGEPTFDEYEEYNRTYWADGDFITDVKMNKIEDALYQINKRVLANAESAYIATDMQEFQMVGIGESLDVVFTFISPNKGKGTAKVSVNGLQRVSQYVDQEVPITIHLPEDYFSKGDNKVSIYVLDRAGKQSNEIVFNVRYGSTEITSDFDSNAIYQYGASVRYYFTASALDTSQDLIFHMVIDGVPQTPMTCKSDVRGFYTFPNNLSIGTHVCSAYVVDASGKQSNVLDFNMVVLDAYSIAISSNTRTPEVEEGDQLVIDYRVFMQYGKEFKIKIYVDGNMVQEGTCGLATEYYRNSTLTEGVYRIKIEASDMAETVSDSIEFDVYVLPSEFQRVESATAGGKFLGTAKDKTNSDANRDKWIAKDQDGNDVIAPLTNFLFNETDGWIDNELVFNGVAGAEIPIKPLANNARYGFTLDIEFASKPIGVDDALVLDLWDYNKNCGVKITTEELIIRSAVGNEARLYYEEDTITSAMFIIDRNEKKAKIYLNGVMCSAFNLSDYEANGVMMLEDFAVDDTIKIAGSGHCRIRNLRVYEVALTTDEILNNYISNIVSKDEQEEMVKFQNGNHLPTLTVYCDFSGLGKDDKKPCKIVYTSTDEEKYGPSFTLDHKKSQLQYQGTSSMAYPIKNYRLNLRDENGDKYYYNFPYGKPECRFTLKADFMSSGHWQNTGLTKWINNNLYNYNEEDEKSMNPKKWFDLQNGGSIDDTRECIYGFPCRLILINDGNTPLNAGQNEPTPGNVKDMGIFNFNHDKDATDTMGFDQDNFPNCMSFEVTANSDTSAGAFMRFKHQYSLASTSNEEHLTEQYACSTYVLASDFIPLPWTITSTNRAMRLIYSRVDTSGGTITVRPGETVTVTEFPWGTDGCVFQIMDSGTEKLTFELNGYVCTMDRFNIINSPILMTDQSDELEYYQQSFEMRFPDPDDYDEWHGFLGLNAGTMVTDYKNVEEGVSTTFWDWEETTLNLNSTALIKTVECYYNDNLLAGISVNKTNTTVRLIDGSNKLRVIFESAPENFYINETKYILGNEVEELSIVNPYLGEEISHDYGLKRLIDWVDNSSDDEFIRDFEKYFNKDYTLRYYLLVITLGMVDNLGKNMMLDTWDCKVFMPRFYDCDTICSYDNTGDIAFDVDIEMEQGYWNTSSSRLWTRVRDLLHNDLVAKYQDMRQNGLSLESLMECFYDEQIAKIPQKYYNQDFDVKYAPFGDSYMGMAHGDGYVHLKRWLKKRLYFTDSLFDYAPSYNNEILTIRANTTELMNLELEVHDPVYVHLSWYNGQMDKKKIGKGEKVTFSGKAMAATDQEVLIYGGSNIKKISGISSTNPSELIIGTATRLTELDASNCPILTQINLNKANLSPHTYLLKVNLDNCPQLNGALRIENSPLLQELSIANTGISTINFATSLRNLKTASFKYCTSLEHLDLTTWDVSRITDMMYMFDGCSGLKTLNVTGWDTSNVTSMLGMFTNCDSLETLDLSSWDVSNVENFYNMFSGCNNLKTININGWMMNNATNVSGMFRYCSALTNVKVDGLYMPKVTTTESMFEGCSSIENIYMVNPEFDDLTRMNCMFKNCTNLKSLNTVLWDTSNVTEMTEMFRGCSSLTTIYGLDNWKTSKVESMTSMFHACSSLRSVNIENWDTSSVVDMGSMFIGCSNIDNLNLDNFVKSTNKNICFMFAECSSLKNLSVKNWDLAGVGSFSHLFNKCYALEHVDTSTWINCDKITDLMAMYQSCTNLKTVDFNFLRLAKPVDFHNIFSACTSLKKVDFSMLNPSAVIRLEGCFSSCISLEEVIFPDMSEAPVANIRQMFNTCSSMKHINLTGWAKSNITDMSYAFQGCSSLESVNLTGMNFIGEVNLAYTFADNPALKTIEMPNLVVTNNRWYFTTYQCFSLEQINVKNADLYTLQTLCNSLTTKTGLPGTIAAEVYDEELANSFLAKNWILKAGLLLVRVISKGECSPNGLSGGYINNNLTVIEDLGDGTKRYSYYGWPGYDTVNFSAYYQLRKVEYLRIDNDVTNLNGLFKNCIYLTEVNTDGWDTSNVTNFERAFYKCTSLKSLDLSKFDVGSATSLLEMFGGANSMTYLNISNWHIGERVSMVSMWSTFTNASSLVDFITTGVTATNVIDTFNLFNGCKQLQSVDFNGWDLSRSGNVISMFESCTNLTSINFDGCTWSTSAAKYNYTFKDCKSLTSLDLHKWDTSKVTAMAGLFHGCSSLETLNINGWDTSKVIAFNATFQGCSSLSTPSQANILANLDTQKAVNMTDMFNGCTSINNIDLRHLDFSSCETMAAMFTGCSSLETINMQGVDTSSVKTIGNMFFRCGNLVTVGMDNLDFSRCTDMNAAFAHCSSLVSTEVISSWKNTGKVVSMKWMFQACTSLTTVALPLDVSKVENMAQMFIDCTSLREISLPSINAPELRDVSLMFNKCTNLRTVNLNHWNTPNLTNMQDMFANCNNLETCTMDGWDTAKVTIMQSLFYCCYYLEEFNLNGFTSAASLVNAINLFNQCTSLTHVYYDEFFIPDSFSDGRTVDCRDLMFSCSNLEEDVNMALCKVAKVTHYNRNQCVKIGRLYPVVDFEGCDTSAITSVNLMNTDTTKVLNFHSGQIDGVTIAMRYTKLDTIKYIHFKYSTIGWLYYEGDTVADKFDYRFETLPGSLSYKAESWVNGNSINAWPNNLTNLLKLGDTKWTVEGIVSLFECLYDYTANGETSQYANIQIGNNLSRLTAQQIAIATSKGWTITA